MIRHCSCYTMLDALAEGDHMICDPPYSPNVHEDATSVNAPAESGGKGVIHRDLGFAPLDIKLQLTLAWLAARQRRWSLLFSDFEGIAPPVHPASLTDPIGWLVALDRYAVEHVRTVPWLRWTQPQLSGDRPAQGGEAILVCHRMAVGAKGGRKPLRKAWNGSGGTAHYDARCLRGSDKCRAEKPWDLMLSLVSDFTDRGNLVVDPTAGHGTTGLACRFLGRRFLGCEEHAGRARVAAERYVGPLSKRDRERGEEWFEERRKDLARTEEDHEPGSNAHRRLVSRARDLQYFERQLVKGKKP